MVTVPRLYPSASMRLLFPDDSTPAIDSAHLQLCFHTMSGYLMGSEAQWVTNGAKGVRSHFGIGGVKDAVGNDGKLIQWTPLNRQAYAQNNGNPYCISVETSDGAVDGLPWSPKQLERVVELLIWFTKLCGRTQPQLANAPGEFGTITYHQQFQTFNTHNHDCPGSVRRTQLATCIKRATALMTRGDVAQVADDIQSVKDLINHDAAIIINGDTGPDPGHASNLKNIRADISTLASAVSALTTKVDQILVNTTPQEPPTNGA